MDLIQGYLTNIGLWDNPTIGFIFQNKFSYAAIIFIAFIILSRFVKFFLHVVLPFFTAKTKTDIDGRIVEKVQGLGSKLVLMLGLYLALIPLELPEKVSFGVNRTILSLAIVLFMVAGIRVIDVIIDVLGGRWAKKTASSIDDALLPLFHKVSKTLFVVFGLIIIVRSWGFNIGSLLAGVGIAGMVLGLAFKDSLANIFGGISIVLDKSLKVGDKVKLSSGELGIIEDIGLRSTKLKTYDNELVTVPNGALANAVITNFTMPDVKHRVGVKFSVEYGSDVEKVKQIVLKSVQGIKDAIYDPEPIVVFTEMADSGLSFIMFIWSTWDKSMGVKEEATKRIYEALNKAKIGIPFPTRTVYMHQVKKNKHH